MDRRAIHKAVLLSSVSRGTMLLDQLEQMQQQAERDEAERVQQDEPPTRYGRRKKKRH